MLATVQAMFLMVHRLTKLYEEGKMTHEQVSHNNLHGGYFVRIFPEHMLGFSGLAMRYMYLAESGASLNHHEFVFSHPRYIGSLQCTSIYCILIHPLLCSLVGKPCEGLGDLEEQGGCLARARGAWRKWHLDGLQRCKGLL